MSAYDDEQARREAAWQHHDDVDVDSAVPVTPRRLGQTVTVRLDPDLAGRLYEYAGRLGWSLPNLLRHAAVSMLGQPIGWRCEHFHITGAPGSVGSASVGCGCQMQPVYHPSEVAA